MITFVLIGIALFGVFGMLLLAYTGNGRKKAEANSEQILDDAFNGESDVTFKINMQTLKYEDVILGAKKRGYKLVHQAENQYGPHTLMFEKAAA